MNVCGLRSRLIVPEFQDLICKYDLIFLTETKAGEGDIFDLPYGYKIKMKNRSKCLSKSGGIAVIYKKQLEQYLKFFKSDSEYVMWMLLSKQLMGGDKDLLVGCVYIPPYGTKYSSADSFSEIQDELVQLN